jgi:putative transposase
LLREAELLSDQGKTIKEISRQLGITEKIYYRWRRDYGGLRVDQAKRRRLWLNDGSCIRLRPERKDHAWSYDFVTIWLSNGKRYRVLEIPDEYTGECLDLYAAKHITSGCVMNRLYNLFLTRGIPEHIKSDNGPEFTAERIREWLFRIGVKTLFIEPGSPWENGYVESFNGKLRDELLNVEIFDTLTEAGVLLEKWRRESNEVRPHSSLDYRAPAPVTYKCNRSLTLKVVQ